MEENKLNICQINASLPMSTVQEKNSKMVPVQFYMTYNNKKRLKMYCLENDMKMTEVLNNIIDEMLERKGY